MDYKFQLKTYEHQMSALEKSRNKKNYGDVQERGKGKKKE